MDGLGKRRGGDTHQVFQGGGSGRAPVAAGPPPPFSPGGCFVAAVSAGARWEPRPAAGGGGRPAAPP